MTLRRCCALLLSVLGLFLVSPSSAAQAAAAGSVEGRVQNLATGDYLNNARISVVGTNLVTLSDEGGFFRLAGVAAGPVTLRVFFTGLDELTVTVTVPPGATAAKDLRLTSRTRYGDAGETVKLDQFIVQAPPGSLSRMPSLITGRSAARTSSARRPTLRTCRSRAPSSATGSATPVACVSSSRKPGTSGSSTAAPG